jgi:glutamate racemase
MGKIGVFDSGYGGLSILRDVVRTLPQYDYIYLGDSARTPYGPRTREEVYVYTREAVDFLFREGCELIILACNTASAQALRRIQQEHMPEYWPGKKVLGVLIPAAESAVEQSTNGRIGVMATQGTVAAGSFVEEIKKLSPQANVFQQACPKLVPLVEAGEINDEPLHSAIREYVRPLIDADIDTLILGCTHYELILPAITADLPSHITVVAEGFVVAGELAEYLERHPEMETKLAKKENRLFYTTGDESTFEMMGGYFYGEPLVATKISLV